MTSIPLSRRSFLAMSAMLPWAFRSFSFAGKSGGRIPVGLELYSVREELKKDAEGTVRAVAAMGYQGVEFYAPYFEWSEGQAKQMRKVLDELGIWCYSTHNDESYFSAKNMAHVRELNSILGCKYVVLAWSDPKTGADHEAEWAAVDGQRPMDILAGNTKPSVMLQLDVGTCLEAGADPVAWIRANPGRIKSIHCKEWAPQRGYKVLFGEGVADWKGIFQAAESVGGVEYYLVEQEGSRFPELETAWRCLEAFRTAHGGR